MAHTEETKVAHTTSTPVAVDQGRMSKIKMAFLYTLIGGLAASAILAIVAILVGEFNSALQKALGTIFIFVTHSLFILALIWADKHNQLGRSVLPTTFLGVALANIITTTLGTWNIIEVETSWRAVLFYFLVIGSAFLVTATLKLRIAHKPTSILLNSSIGLVVAWTILLAPWVFEVVERFNPLYYRVAGALTILLTTVFLIGIIVRAIAVAHSAEVRAKAQQKVKVPITGGLLAIYITLGTITAFVWFGGIIGFIIDGVSDTSFYERPANTRTY